MTHREKLLLTAVGVLVLAWGGWTVVTGYFTALDDKRAELRTAEQELRSRRLEQMQTDQARANLERWQEMSLPRDLQVAKTVYRDWLMNTLTSSGLDFDNRVRLGMERTGRDAYNAISYQVTAEGGIDEITRFLYAFYDSPQTHKITRLKLMPSPSNSRQVQMDLTVEALSVAGTTRETGVAEGSSGRLALGDVSAYVESIEGRNLFVPYEPPPPPRPERQVAEPTPPARFDDATQARVTAVTNDGARRVAWVLVRTTGERLYLYEGDKVEVGQFSGRVKAINKRSLVIEADEGELLISLGDTLREGRPLRGS